MTTDKISSHELQILREIAGLQEPSPWGAWVGVCLEYLYENSYITAMFGGRPTEKGYRALESHSITKVEPDNE